MTMMKLLFVVTLILLVIILAVNTKQPCEHGVHYPDVNLQQQDAVICECFQCYVGDRCQIKLPDDQCSIVDVGGDPLMFQQYWLGRASSWANLTRIQEFQVDIEPSYRTGYSTGLLNQTLYNEIVRLHNKIGNANTENKYIVFGTGGTNLIAASMWALSTLFHEKTKGRPASVFAKIPYYGGYRDWASMYPSQTVFNSSMDIPDPSSVIEYVAYPNNPTGELRDPVYTRSPYIVHDMVYYWPSLTKVEKKMNFDIMLFSMSKLTGHAGSRFGWALVSDYQVATLMNKFISTSQIHTSVDTQYRVLQLLRYLNNDNDDTFFSYVRYTMTERWNRIQATFQNTQFFQITSVPNQFYVLVRCTSQRVINKEITCYQLFQKVGLNTWSGDGFGLEPGLYTRMELVIRDSTFDILEEKLKLLFANVRE